MLPSTKIFKGVICPYFEENGECLRAYCHFSHTKSDNSTKTNTVSTTNELSLQAIQILQPPVPVYIPTPKHILESRKPNGTKDNTPEKQTEQIKKKPRLEYVPKPKNPNDNSNSYQVYVPTAQTNHIDMAIDKYSEKFHDDIDDLSGLATELLLENVSSEQNDDTNFKSENEISNNEKDKSDSNQKQSHSHSDRHKHKSLKESSSSYRSSSSKHKSSHSHSHSSSGSSSSRSKSKHSDHDRLSSKDNNKSSSSSHKHSSRHKSSSSSSSKRKHDANHHSKTKSSNGHSGKNIVCGTDSGGDDDDIEAQCRMIFDQFDPSTIEKSEPMNDDEKNSEDPLAKYDDFHKRKRVAYENNDPKPLISHNKAPNHVHNAMQSVFARQDVVRKQIEEKYKKQKEELARREEEEKRKLLELELTNPKPTLTPIISPTALTQQRFGPRSFMPVSNALAIQKAKEKIDQLRAEKLKEQPSFSKTIAQTSTKGIGRIAHAPAPAVAAEKSTKVAPPVLEASSTKISYNIRMQYYNLMVKHCLTIYDDCNDAWERAQTEELAVFKKCKTPIIYKNSASLAVNKLRKEALDAGNVNTEKHKIVSHDVILAGKLGQQVSWSVNKKLKTDISGSSNIVDTLPSSKAYELIAELCLKEEQLRDNGYPRAGEKPGTAIICKAQSAVPNNERDRYCRRCGKTFTLDQYDEECIDQCNYHPKSPGFRRGFADNAHRCCQQPAGSPGCMYANYHVSEYLDYNNLTGFIKTISPNDDYVPTRKDIFALDCEMCYTTAGLELTRVTVVDINRKIVYDALVKPDNKIIDYNTTYSGISEKSLENITRTLRDVQAALLTKFNAKTILIGHSLESDLKALKLIHECVVDTSVLYPHKMGPPKKRALKTLCIEHLKKIIQEDDAGHNSAEDAEVCIDLVKHYLRNRII